MVKRGVGGYENTARALFCFLCIMHVPTPKTLLSSPLRCCGWMVCLRWLDGVLVVALDGASCWLVQVFFCHLCINARN